MIIRFKHCVLQPNLAHHDTRLANAVNISKNVIFLLVIFQSPEQSTRDFIDSFLAICHVQFKFTSFFSTWNTMSSFVQISVIYNDVIKRSSPWRLLICILLSFIFGWKRICHWANKDLLLFKLRWSSLFGVFMVFRQNCSYLPVTSDSLRNSGRKYFSLYDIFILGLLKWNLIHSKLKLREKYEKIG